MRKVKPEILDFARALLDAGDLDPVYVAAHYAGMPPTLRNRWLLAYWCFYDSGTAAVVAEGYPSETAYWGRMATAAASKEWPRGNERRHFRGQQAAASVAYLTGRGLDPLFRELLTDGAPRSASWVITKVRGWVGFGPWIGFKVADMLERLGVLKVNFDLDTVMYESPALAADLLWELKNPGREATPAERQAFAVRWLQAGLGGYWAPPLGDRPLGLQEFETILCKWKSHCAGKYTVGEDVAHLKKSLDKYNSSCELAARLAKAAVKGGLW